MMVFFPPSVRFENVIALMTSVRRLSFQTCRIYIKMPDSDGMHLCVIASAITFASMTAVKFTLGQLLLLLLLLSLLLVLLPLQ